MALRGKIYKPAKGTQNLRDQPIGGVRVFLGKVIADIVKVGVGLQGQGVGGGWRGAAINGLAWPACPDPAGSRL